MKVRSIRKALGIVMMATMVFTASTLTAMASAQPQPGGYGNKITITNPQKENLTYSAYQVFKGDIDTLNNKVVLSNPEWGDGVNSAALLTALKGLTIGTTQPFASCATAKDVVEVISPMTNDSEAMQKIAEVIFNNVSTTKETSTQNATNPEVYTINVVDKGYYLVVDENALAVATGRTSKYALVLVSDATATIAVKTEVPSGEKKVKENQADNYTGTPAEVQKYGEGFNDVADYNIGDTVPFELLSAVPNMSGLKSYYYELVDRMDPAFTFNSDVEVYIGTTKLTAGTDYTLVPPSTSTDPNAKPTFSVVFSDLKKLCDTKGFNAGDVIKVTFSAVLNEKAKIGAEGNKNEFKIRYGNTPSDIKDETPWDDTIVLSYKLDVTKYDGDDPTIKLDGAEFKFYRMNGTAKEYLVLENGKVKTWTDDESAASVLVSDAKGEFSITGLDEGVYYLVETKAPTGYNLLTDPVKVTIFADTNNGHDGTANALTGTQVLVGDQTTTNLPKHTPNYPEGHEAIDIANQSGVVLPSTGGMGTKMFYMIGGVLLVGASVLLVSRKRMNG